jgi:hypothetical protein
MASLRYVQAVGVLIKKCILSKLSCFDPLCTTKDNDDILKLVAREWRALTDRDRAQWDEEARNDKVR